jgi:hypothetical protein
LRQALGQGATVQLHHQLVVQRVPRIAGYDVTDHRTAQNGQVTDEIKDFVTDELILESEVTVEDTVGPKDNRVLQRPAFGQAVFTQPLQVAEKTIGARRGDLLDKDSFGHGERGRLGSHHRVIQIEGIADPEVLSWNDLDPTPVIANPNRFTDMDRAPGGRLNPPASRVQEIDKRLGAPVQGGQLVCVQLDLKVIDSEGVGRRKEVFNRLDATAVLPKGRGVVAVGQGVRVGCNCRPTTMQEAEMNPGTRGGGPKDEPNGLARVKANPSAFDRLTDCLLKLHL